MNIIIKPAGVVVLFIGLLVALFAPVVAQRRVARAARPTAASTRLDSPVLAVGTGDTKDAPSLGSGWKSYMEKGAVCQFTPLDSPDLPARPAYRFAVQNPGPQQWSVGFNNGVSGRAIRDGEPLRIRFWGRSPQRTKICVLMQKNVAPFPHCWKQYVVMEPEWKEYEFTFHAAAYAQGEALMTILLGIDTGTTEIADIRLEPAK